MNEEKKYSLIEAYLAGRLNASEARQVTEQFPEELELHRDVTESLRGEKIHQLRAVLKQVDQEWRPPQAVTRRLGIRWIVGLAASVLLLAVVYFWWSSPGTSQDLFAANFEPYTMVLNQRSGGPEPDVETQHLNAAITAYTAGDFETAFTGFQRLQELDPDNAFYRFYAGITALGSGATEVAIERLTQLLESSDPRLREQAQWYLALAMLKNNNTEAAKYQLLGIPEGAFKRAEAQALARKL